MAPSSSSITSASSLQHRYRSGSRRSVVISSADPLSLQSIGQAVCERLHYLDPGEVLVVSFDERPRGDRRARARDHVVDGGGIVRPSPSVAPILIGDLPALVTGAAA